MTAVVSTVLYLADIGEHSALHKISKNVHIKTYIYKHNIVFLVHSTNTDAHTVQSQGWGAKGRRQKCCVSVCRDELFNAIFKTWED